MVFRGVNRSVYDGFATSLTLKSVESTKTFLFGNPFMSEIDLHAFFATNSGTVTGKESCPRAGLS